MQENFDLFFANLCTAANCCARYCDLRVEEKKENHMVDIKMKTILICNKYFKLTLMNHPYLR
jgi:hypothetical protein